MKINFKSFASILAGMFIIGISVIIRIGLMVGVPPIISVAMGYLPLASAQSVYHSIELRAYVMELGMTYLAIYASIRLFVSIANNNLNNKREWVLFTAITLIGLLTRFSFMITISACYASIFLYSLYHKRSLRHNINIKQLFVSAFIVYASFVFFNLIESRYISCRFFDSKYSSFFFSPIIFQNMREIMLISLSWKQIH